MCLHLNIIHYTSANISRVIQRRHCPRLGITARLKTLLGPTVAMLSRFQHGLLQIGQSVKSVNMYRLRGNNGYALVVSKSCIRCIQILLTSIEAKTIHMGTGIGLSQGTRERFCKQYLFVSTLKIPSVINVCFLFTFKLTLISIRILPRKTKQSVYYKQKGDCWHYIWWHWSGSEGKLLIVNYRRSPAPRAIVIWVVWVGCSVYSLVDRGGGGL